MSTKVPEACPRCNIECMPNDNPVTYKGIDFDFIVRVWNYDCESCGWTWANDAQRAHNRVEFNKKYNKSVCAGGWFQ